MNKSLDDVMEDVRKYIVSIKQDMNTQLDSIGNELDQNYNQLGLLFENSEMMNLNANHHLELQSKIVKMNSQSAV